MNGYLYAALTVVVMLLATAVSDILLYLWFVALPEFLS